VYCQTEYIGDWSCTAKVKVVLVSRQWYVQSVANQYLEPLVALNYNCVLQMAEQYNRLRSGTKIGCLYRCCMKSIVLYMFMTSRSNVL
jgi:hypothetical protein